MSFRLRAGRVLFAAVLAGNAFVPQNQAAEQSPQVLTMQQALEEAFVRSTVLKARRAETEQAKGRLLTAKTYPFNPVIAVEGIRRTRIGESTTDRTVRLEQEIEIGGKRRRRTARAAAELDASRARLLREERLLAARVHTAFVETLRFRELLEVEQTSAGLARSLAEIARKRFDAGEVPQMEVNLARALAGRAGRELLLAEGAFDVSRAILAEAIGLDPSRPPMPEGELELPPRELPALSYLLAGAEANRADLQAVRAAGKAAEARIDLARRQVIPNLLLEGFYGREDSTDRLAGAELRVRIPLFNRNRGEIAMARASRQRARAETQTAEIRIRREVADRLARYRAGRAAAEHMQREVLGTHQENLNLLQLSFEAGKTGWTEVLVFRREFVEIQRDYIATIADTRLAGVELDLAAGIVPAASHKEHQP